MNKISQSFSKAQRIAISSLKRVTARSATTRDKQRALTARVLASAETVARVTAQHAMRQSALLSGVARPVLARAAATTRSFTAREYSRPAKSRALVPIAGIALAAALLAFGATRANAKSTNGKSTSLSGRHEKQRSVASKEAARVLARADADFDNAEPGRAETAWGHFVADAMKNATGADLALVNAASLAPGTLQRGGVTSADIDALLAYADDDIVTRSISGAQLRAALELAMKDAPNDSPRFLHVAGLTATFASNTAHGRIRDLKVNGRAIENSDTFNVAMPIGLSQGAGGFFTIWGRDDDAKNGGALNEVLRNYAAKRGRIAPDDAARIAAN